jgi:hypothetical protein
MVTSFSPADLNDDGRKDIIIPRGGPEHAFDRVPTMAMAPLSGHFMDSRHLLGAIFRAGKPDVARWSYMR